MTGNRALLTNFMEKFFETVRFGNNDFAVIIGHGDAVIGSMVIKKVYYVEALELMLPWSLKKNTKCLLLLVKILVLPGKSDAAGYCCWKF
uniref:Integrase, catalytic region, zinc finger, CCHC-type, peptidase aspartic, catalytic n=1 Tax=Tanacetum cinerariifolium TaxID=118510 RepID=A0A699SWN2_TANCI|nr:integrase, catalytic region, zinc finger, CCHC-type, peptidase aspartic, catalytic [Tanacetum cinerariifolium]